MMRLWAAIMAATLILSLGACDSGTAEPVSPGTSGSSAASREPISSKDTVSLSEERMQELSQMILQSAAYITEPFSSVAEISAYDLARFLYVRMEQDGAADSFERLDNDQYIQVPMDRIREYASIFFGFSDIKVDFASQQYFDGIQNMTIPNPDKSPKEPPYELEVDKIEPGTGKVTITLDLSSGGNVYQRWVYMLRIGREGNLYIASMSKRPVEFGLYGVNNAVATLENMMGIPVTAFTADGFQFVPFEENMVVSYSNGRDLRVGILNMNTYKSDKYVLVEGANRTQGSFRVTISGENICVYQPSRVTILDRNLTVTREIVFPQSLLDMCDGNTTQFVLSPDLKYLVYADAEALNYFNLETSVSSAIRTQPKGAIWQPIAFEQGGDLLLGMLLEGKEISNFGTFSLEGIVDTIRISAGPDTVFGLVDDRLMAFSPTSAYHRDLKKDIPLENAFVEYNIPGRTMRAASTDFLILEEYGSPPDRTLISNNYVFRVETMDVGKNLVSSVSVKAYDHRSERQFARNFGYVDRDAVLRLKAVSASDKVVAQCRGMFVRSIVVF